MKTVAVIFGGQSTEHDVSIITAIGSVITPLELTREYEVVAVYVAKDGSWYWDDRFKRIETFQDPNLGTFLHKAPKVHLLFDGGLVLVKSSQFAGRKQYKKIDLVFPAMHGTHGEDGELMGILEMAGAAYVGCGVAASAIAMDKVLAKQVTSAAGIATNKWVWAYSHELEASPEEVMQRISTLRYPLFVKPAHLGSSIGITRVEDEKNIHNALEVAAHYDDKIIIEEAVPNLIEVTLPIIGNDEPLPAFLEQPAIGKKQFFDFDTKYMKGKKGGKKLGADASAQGYSTIPAPLDEDLYSKAEALGLAVYKALGCSGIARVDMLINAKIKDVFFNEVNPLPGSLYAHNWQRKGISKTQLVTELIRYAEERHANKQKLHTTFSTNFLKQF